MQLNVQYMDKKKKENLVNDFVNVLIGKNIFCRLIDSCEMKTSFTVLNYCC